MQINDDVEFKPEDVLKKKETKKRIKYSEVMWVWDDGQEDYKIKTTVVAQNEIGVFAINPSHRPKFYNGRSNFEVHIFDNCEPVDRDNDSEDD